MNKSLSVIQPALSPLWRGFETISNYVDKSCQVFGAILLAAMWALLMVNALAKWFDFTQIGWSMEITAYMIAWSIFIMMGPVTRSDEHIKVSFLPEKVLGKEKGATFMFALESILGLALCIFLSIHAYNLIIHTKAFGLRIESSAGWYYPMWIVRSGVFAGFVISALFYLERTIKWLRQLLTGDKTVTACENPMLNVATTTAGEGGPKAEDGKHPGGREVSPKEGK